MNTDRYKKAEKLITEGQVVLESKTQKALYFKVKCYDVRIGMEQNSCTCHHYTYDAGLKKNCSHIIAAEAYLVFQSYKIVKNGTANKRRRPK